MRQPTSPVVWMQCRIMSRSLGSLTRQGHYWSWGRAERRHGVQQASWPTLLPPRATTVCCSARPLTRLAHNTCPASSMSRRRVSIVVYVGRWVAVRVLVYIRVYNLFLLPHYVFLFHFASEPPDLLEECVIRNQTTHSVFVTCKGIPTELPRTFTMEVRHSGRFIHW